MVLTTTYILFKKIKQARESQEVWKKKRKARPTKQKVTIAVGLATLIQMIIDLIIRVLQYIK